MLGFVSALLFAPVSVLVVLSVQMFVEVAFAAVFALPLFVFALALAFAFAFAFVLVFVSAWFVFGMR